MERDIKSIILLLTTQAMINLGVIDDPISQEKKVNIDGANIFIQLLQVLENKTRGNLTDEESKYLKEVLSNLEQIFQRVNTK